MNLYGTLKKLKDYFQDLHFRRIRAKVAKVSFNEDFDRDLWRLVKTVVGVEPKQTFYCPICFVWNRERVPLVLRKSKMSVDIELDYRNQHFDLHFKCPQCGNGAYVFGVPVPLQHWRYVKSLRREKGIGLIFAPKEQWDKKEKIKKQLEKLGYW